MSKTKVKKYKDVIFLMWLMLTTTLSALGYLAPQDIEYAMSQAELLEHLQIELNSSFSLLSKPCSAWVQQVGSYTCFGNGSNGHLEAYSTDDDDVINWALGNLTAGRTWQETVLLKGNFTIDSPIIVYNYTVLELQGKVGLADNSDCNMIQNAHPTTYDLGVTICGGCWYGNRHNQASGHGIFWNHTTEPGGASGTHQKSLEIHDIEIVECKQHGIYLDFKGSSTSSFQFNDFRTKWHDGYGIYFNYCDDGMLSNGLIDGQTNGVLFTWSGMITMTNFYINKGILTNGTVHDCTWSNLIIDCGAQHGMDLEGFKWNAVSNIRIHKMINAAANYDGIRLGSFGGAQHSYNNTFMNINIQKGGAAGANDFRYGIIEEDANQDYNIYSVVNAYDAATMGISISGANSHVCCSWNGTSWIDNYP